MFRCHLVPCSYLLLVTVILTASGRGACLCRQDQRDALQRLKASFRFNFAFKEACLSSWKVDTNCCTWEGVKCDGTLGYVTELDLSDLWISGNLSFSDIFKLTSLRYLSLAGNNFNESPWPNPGFEQLKDLKYLDLSFSGLSGALPVENGQLSNLVALNLSGLDLKDLSLGTLIDSLGSLQELNLDVAKISVSPTDLAHASSANTSSSLRELSMWDCTITSGRFDTFLMNLLFRSKLANLVTLYLSGVDLEILSIHALIDNLVSLQKLNLGNINISSSPNDLAHASSTNTTSGLKELTMWQYTTIGGHLNTALTYLLFHSKLANLATLDLFGLDLKYLSLDTLINNLGSLQKLYLHDVNISVNPIDLAHASSTNTISGLKELRMWRCKITGSRFDTVLTKIPYLSNLVILDLSGIDLKNSSLDALTDKLGNLQKLYLDSVSISVSSTDLPHASSTNMMPGLKELSMTWCIITGRIDVALTKFRFLSKLTLDGTNFSGPIPVPERFVDSALTVLSLRSCQLTTTFPSWIFRIKSLTSLDVSGNENLRGELPEFKEGSALQELMLSGTKFSGKIPESISNLRNLTRLDLSNCQFHGPIPPFAQWPMISWVDLSGNNLTGSLPSDGYVSLQNLTGVYLSNNSIGGVIPASLFSHPSLENLDLSQNSFTGNLLLYPNISSSLRGIDVSFNKLQGPIPKLLSKFVGLYLLDLSSNNFNGTVDLSFIKNYNNYLEYLSLSYNKWSVVEEGGNHSYAEYPAIRELGLASCNLSDVPKFLMHQRSIYILDLSNNYIGGHIPDWIWGIGGGLSLNLSHNLFTSIERNLSNKSIYDLDLNSNKIQGSLPLPPWGTYRLDYSNNHFNSSIMPEFWSRISSAKSLSLGNNSITGEVSHLICSATDLQVLDLSFNSFSGLIPPCLLKDNAHLEILNLRGNNFHGSLPQDISEDCALQIIDLNGNKLEGKLPVSLINCQMLQVLDLGNNLIVDMYPEWLGVLPLLKVLVLKSNGFHGPIDHSGMSKQKNPFFRELQVLDLSSNSLNGSIPALFLKQLKAMMVDSSGAFTMYVGIIPTSSSSASSPGSGGPYYRESVTVTLKGQETTLVQILSVFMYIDLSNNSFEGIIPNEIGELKFLKQLNLSRNSFTGGIPSRIANMLQLESLDLSYNQLSREIPPAMALMSFLEMLNLSYNHLSGQIPQSNQFLTFPNTSFLGNDGLCGKPLTRQCESNVPSAAPTPGSSKELNWEFLSVEVGVVSGLAIVVATMLLWINGRRWLNWHVDKFWLQVLQPWICRRRR